MLGHPDEDPWPEGDESWEEWVVINEEDPSVDALDKDFGDAPAVPVSAPGGDTQGKRVLHLMYSQEDHAAILDMVEQLMERLGTMSRSAAVMVALAVALREGQFVPASTPEVR